MTSVAAVASIVFVPESPVRTPGRISVLPAVLLSGWLVALLLALSEAPKWGWGSGRTIGLLVACRRAGRGWIRVEQRAAVPLIDMHMMRLPGVWTTNLVALLVGVGMYASFGFIPAVHPDAQRQWVRLRVERDRVRPAHAAVGCRDVRDGPLRRVDPRRVGPKARRRVRLRCSPPAGCSCWRTSTTPSGEIAVSNGITGVGIGLAFACLAGLIVGAVPPEQTGVASGMNANIRTIGGSVGTAVMASIVTAHFLPSGFPKEIGYTAGFAVLGGALLLAAVAGLAIPTTSAKQLEEQLEQEPAPESVLESVNA